MGNELSSEEGSSVTAPEALAKPAPGSRLQAFVATEAPGLTPARKLVALGIAGTSDLAQMVFFPEFVEGAASPFELALDALTAMLILFVVGFHWRLAIALATELVPGADLFPTWTAVVLSLPTKPKPPKLNP